MRATHKYVCTIGLSERLEEAPLRMDLVNPFIGTAGFGFGAGNHNPGAQVMHGELRLGPDTGIITLPFNHNGGYHFADRVVRAFSHTHLVGAGVGDYGNFGVLPVWLPSRDPTDEDVKAICLDPRKRALPLKHSEENAGMGWYALNVSSVAIQVELAAAGSHAGVHAYTFSRDDPNDGVCGILVDACATAWAHPELYDEGNHWCKTASISVEPNNHGVRVIASINMAGQLSRRADNRSLLVHFAMELDRATPWRLWASDKLSPMGTTTATSTAASLGALVRVPCAATSTARTAISFVSATQALTNLHKQAPLGTTAAAARATAEASWRAAISRVQITDAADADEATQRAFMTAVYRTRLAPTIWDESGGIYQGMDGSVHRMGVAKGDTRRHAYTDMSLWDIHRTQLPWLSLTAPEVFEDVVRSLEAMGAEGGDVPRWPLANAYTGCMIGNHAIAVVAEAVAKGHRGFNASALYTLLRRHATEARPHASRAAVAEWVKYGFVPAEADDRSASLTLSYAFDDASLATIARHLGLHDDAAVFANRSRSAVHAGWSAERQLMCPRSKKTGALACPALPDVPYPFGPPAYVEGDALQWVWFVPQDPSVLVDLFPSNDSFVAKLDRFVQNARKWPTTALPNPYYWAGNEPDLLAPWLFAFAGAQDKTAHATRHIADTKYSDQPDGLPGNDDYGTLSSWLVWARLGLYPLAGSDRFILGSPRFKEVVVGVGSEASGCKLRVVAHNASSTSMYILRAEINGVAIDVKRNPFVRFADLVPKQPGGTSVLEVWLVGE